MSNVRTPNHTMKVGSDTKFREHVIRAARRFEAANPNLDKRIMMTVVDTHLIEFMWLVFRQSRPIGPLAIEDAFRAIILDFTNRVINGEALPHSPIQEDARGNA